MVEFWNLKKKICSIILGLIQGQRQTERQASGRGGQAGTQAGQGLHTKHSFFFVRNAQEYTNNVFSLTFFIITNLIHKFLVHSHKLHKLNSSTCFERNPLIIRRSTMQIVHMQPLVSSLSTSDRLVQPLRKDSPNR